MSRAAQSQSLIDSLAGEEPETMIIDDKTTKLSNEYIDMYVQKKNVLLVVDKRDDQRKKIYNGLKTAMHYLQKRE